MSRRKGQNPRVRVGKRADGTKYYFFQYWLDVPGREERKRQRSDRTGKPHHAKRSGTEEAGFHYEARTQFE